MNRFLVATAVLLALLVPFAVAQQDVIPKLVCPAQGVASSISQPNPTVEDRALPIDQVPIGKFERNVSSAPDQKVKVSATDSHTSVHLGFDTACVPTPRMMSVWMGGWPRRVGHH